jgi:hypothetical protein
MISLPVANWFFPAASARLSLACALLLVASVGRAAQFTIAGPTGSGLFGSTVTTLPNGNIVVIDPGFDFEAITDVGAVYLYRPNGTLISTLRGSSANDRIGSEGVVVLANGNYVVASSNWDNGAIANAGAVTFGSGTSGISGVVSAANSLVGSSASDFVGNAGVTALSNGNYVVRSVSWNNGAATSAGAVTLGSGTSGISGVVSAANSLVGSSASDFVGNAGVTAMSNGNYVVSSPNWDNGAITDVGAATFGSGTSGIRGVVSAANSLVGSSASDQVGNFGVTALSNGNYVVSSPTWDNGAIVNAGAATFGSGTSGVSGVVSATNSLVGSSAIDNVSIGVTALSNGNYVVRSAAWDNGVIVNAGAATFGSGTSGVSGVVSATNSLVGSSASDQVGNFGVTALSNGNYVVLSRDWDNGAITDAGAATFGSGTSGISGVVSAANSLVGSSASDQVGSFGVTALSNGNYVVLSRDWDNGAIVNAGAVTLSLSNGSIVGTITNTHSVLGTLASQGGSHSFSYDALRNQLAVGQPASNRVVLQRTGIATTISIVGDTPDPSLVGQPVTFTATVSASPNAPTNGQVRFTASTGQSCVDTTPTATSTTSANFSCTIAFTSNGVTSVSAEYTGSIIHAYSGSGPETHTTIVAELIFANGFE